MKNTVRAFVIIVITVAAFVFVATSDISCIDKDGTIALLTSQGFTNINITGYDCFSCGKGDVYHTGFTAQSPNGSFVKGTVCKGWLKGATIRFK